MVFLNPLASTLKVWMVFFFVLDILFKSIWTWCDELLNIGKLTYAGGPGSNFGQGEL